MSTGFGRRATRDLARVGLTLAPQPRSGRRAALAVLLVLAAFAAGFGVDELIPDRAAPVAAATPPPAAAALRAELAALRQQLEQAKMGLRVAESRGQELEKQIDALNQKLTESQDELTFFRKAREGKKH